MTATITFTMEWERKTKVQEKVKSTKESVDSKKAIIVITVMTLVRDYLH